MTRLPVSLLVGLCCVSCVHGYHVLIDADEGRFVQTLESPEHNSITWSTTMEKGRSGRCSQRGVLKLDFDGEDGRTKKDKVLLDMWFDHPYGMTFNIGDSTTNNGGGGDAGDFSNDAEIYSLGSTLNIHGNELAGRKPLITRRGIVQNRLQMILSEGQITWNSFGKEFDSILHDAHLFALNNQSDSSGSSNSDVYVGINRSVGAPGRGLFAWFLRNSRGLCRMEITWLDWSPDSM